jgi:hypothetical protein
MIVLNYSHPITDDQRARIESLAGVSIDRIADIPVHFDQERPFDEQAAALAQASGLTSEQWQTESLLINPPAFAPGAVVLLAYLHGLMGYFPPVVRIRPVAENPTRRFEVAEVVDLQQTRERGRMTRTQVDRS